MAARKKPAAQTMQDMVLKALEAAGGFSYFAELDVSNSFGSVTARSAAAVVAA